MFRTVQGGRDAEDELGSHGTPVAREELVDGGCYVGWLKFDRVLALVADCFAIPRNATGQDVDTVLALSRCSIKGAGLDGSFSPNEPEDETFEVCPRELVEGENLRAVGNRGVRRYTVGGSVEPRRHRWYH